MNLFKYFSVLVISLILISSCSDDSTNPTNSDLNGEWFGEIIVERDTARYTINVTENNSLITGTAELYGYHYKKVGNTTISDESKIKSNVSGVFQNSQVGIKFTGNESNHFDGEMNIEKSEINGIAKIHFFMADTIIQYPLTLTRKQ